MFSRILVVIKVVEVRVSDVSIEELNSIRFFEFYYVRQLVKLEKLEICKSIIGRFLYFYRPFVDYY